MKRKLKLVILLLLAAVLAIGILIYSRPMQLSQICGGIDLSKIEAYNVTYEVHPDDGVTQYRIEKDDSRFLLITNLITAQRYRRSLLSFFPQTIKTHRLQDGDFKWELGCVASDVALQNGEIVTGNVIHISNFFGELEISFIGKTWRCTAENQEKWIAEMMDTMRTE